MQFKEFFLLFMFCYNKIDKEYFDIMMEKLYNSTNEGYNEENWRKFQANMWSYLTQRKEVYAYIVKSMKGYEG